KKIDSLAEKGLTRSVLAEVDKIYTAAKKTENTPQVVKALIYRLNFGYWIDEDGQVNTILALQQEAERAAFPLRQISHSMAAERLWEYYQQNRYRILNRSETVQFNPKDLNTWDLRRIVSASIYHYEQSLKAEDSLKRVPVGYLDAVLAESPDSLRKAARALRPTLYDFLAHRALDFYSGSEPGLTRPADHFEVRDPEAFAPAEAFIRHSFATTDSLSLHARALAVLQDLLAFHQNDADPAPRVMVDLQRLQFSRKHTTHPAKDSIYLVALETLEKSHRDHPVSATVAYERAEVLYNLPNHGRGPNNSNRWDYKKALEICDAMIERFPTSRGARQCRNLRQQILQPTLALTVEAVNIPDQPFRALLTSSNVDTWFGR
ncbi:MAG: hypothetical protein AAGB22_14735, partial [Bacteroidota bacterium]